MAVVNRWVRNARGWLNASLLRQFVSLISLTGALILVLNYAFISYFFSHSLLGSIEAVEADYMRMQAGNIEVQIRNYRNRLFDAALDTELLSLAKRYMAARQEDRAMVERSILEYISLRLQFADAAAATLVLPDGAVVFKSRLKDDTRQLGWFGFDGGRTHYNRALEALCEGTLEARNVQVGLEPHVYPLTGTYLIHMACPLFDMYSREIFGTVILSFNTRTLRAMTNPEDNAKQHARNSTGMLIGGGAVIAHERAELIGKTLVLDGADPRADAGDAFRFGPDEQALSQPLGLLGFTLYRVIDKTALLQEPRRYTVSMTLTLSLIIVIGLLLVTLTVRRLMRSVRALQSGLLSVQAGDLDVLVPIDESSEIGQIIHSFNDMARQLRHSDHQRLLRERETLGALNRQRIAEIKALENQINSHFLYNTLNTINYTALAAGNLDVSRQLKHLSRMLRYTFEKSDGAVTAKREAEWLGEYLALQKLRYGNAFEYGITLEPELEVWPMRKLLLQPFVENCLAHGLFGRARGGWIGIAFRRHGERMRVTITDNGQGIPPERMELLNGLLKGTDATGEVGIGLENALLRINTYYRAQAKVVIRSWRGIGTKVVLLLPEYRDHDAP